MAVVLGTLLAMSYFKSVRCGCCNLLALWILFTDAAHWHCLLIVAEKFMQGDNNNTKATKRYAVSLCSLLYNIHSKLPQKYIQMCRKFTLIDFVVRCFCTKRNHPLSAHMSKTWSVDLAPYKRQGTIKALQCLVGATASWASWPNKASLSYKVWWLRFVFQLSKWIVC